MARRTKAEAEYTRAAILDAAEQLFYKQGVSRTTLEKIAQAAGVTRGAIYWHFQNKADLFTAMLERINIPFQQLLDELNDNTELDPLSKLRNLMIQSLQLITSSDQHHRVLTIVFYRCEYIDELNPGVCRQEELEKARLSQIEQILFRAQQAGLLHPQVNPVVAAKALHAYMGGLIANYLLKPDECDLSHIPALIDIIFAGLRKPDNHL